MLKYNYSLCRKKNEKCWFDFLSLPLNMWPQVYIMLGESICDWSRFFHSTSTFRFKHWSSGAKGICRLTQSVLKIIVLLRLLEPFLDAIASPSTYPCQSVGQSVIDSIASPRFASFLICFLDLFSLPDPIFLASFFFSDCAEVTDPDPAYQKVQRRRNTFTICIFNIRILKYKFKEEEALLVFILIN